MPKHVEIFLKRISCGGEIAADHKTVRSAAKGFFLKINAKIQLTAAGELDIGFGMNEAEDRDRFHDFFGSKGFSSLKRCPGSRIQNIDWQTMKVIRLELEREIDPVFLRLPHSKNTARAHFDTILLQEF